MDDFSWALSVAWSHSRSLLVLYGDIITLGLRREGLACFFYLRKDRICYLLKINSKEVYQVLRADLVGYARVSHKEHIFTDKVSGAKAEKIRIDSLSGN